MDVNPIDAVVRREYLLYSLLQEENFFDDSEKEAFSLQKKVDGLDEKLFLSAWAKPAPSIYTDHRENFYEDQ